jgi:hypothetical protein
VTGQTHGRWSARVEVREVKFWEGRGVHDRHRNGGTALDASATKGAAVGRQRYVVERRRQLQKGLDASW